MKTLNPIEIYSDWISQLQEAGFRLTRPLKAVIKVLLDTPFALSPLEVYDRGRNLLPRLGLVTVYRSLEKLDQLGLVERVHLPDGCHRYLRAAEGHQHLLLCTACGRAEYFSGDDLSSLTDAVSRRSEYTIDGHWLQLFGLCKDCQMEVE